MAREFARSLLARRRRMLNSEAGIGVGEFRRDATAFSSLQLTFRWMGCAAAEA
jgi:hypothetical protein